MHNTNFSPDTFKYWLNKIENCQYHDLITTIKGNMLFRKERKSKHKTEIKMFWVYPDTMQVEKVLDQSFEHDSIDSTETASQSNALKVLSSMRGFKSVHRNNNGQINVTTSNGVNAIIQVNGQIIWE